MIPVDTFFRQTTGIPAAPANAVNAGWRYDVCDHCDATPVAYVAVNWDGEPCEPDDADADGLASVCSAHLVQLSVSQA